MTAAIELHGVSVSYGTVVALDDVSLAIATGRVTGLIGMNGSGKSTLFKTVMGLVKPRSGSIRVAGVDPASARARGIVGYVPQSEDVDWSFPVSVRDVVMMGRYGRLGPTRRPHRVDDRAVDDAIARVELTDYADRQIGQLSGGQKKRTFVARCLAQEAGILLLDEPFAGVDKRSESTIVRLLRELAGVGTTVVVSTHDLQALPQLADDAVVMMHRVLFSGPVDAALEPVNLARAFGIDPLERRQPPPGPPGPGDDHAALPGETGTGAHGREHGGDAA